MVDSTTGKSWKNGKMETYILLASGPREGLDSLKYPRPEKLTLLFL